MRLTQRCYLLAILIIFNLGCGKDKSADDYAREKQAEDLARLNSVVGQYTGLVNRGKDEVGAMLINLQLTSLPNSGSPLSTPSLIATASLLTKALDRGKKVQEIPATLTSFDAITGHFDGCLHPQMDKTTPTLSCTTIGDIIINAVIDDSSFSGEVGAVGYPELAGQFALTKQGEPLDQLLSEHPVSISPFFPKLLFSGGTTFNSSPGTFRAANLVMQRPAEDEINDFWDVFIPVKTIIFSLDYGGNATFEDIAATFDTRTGSADARLSFGDEKMEGNCWPSAGEAPGFPEKIICNHRLPTQSDVATTNLSVVQPPLKRPTDDSSTRNPVIVNFFGYGHFQGRVEKVTLTVMEEVETRLFDIMNLFFPVSEKVLRVTVVLPATQTTVPFNQGKWDIPSGRLDAQQSRTAFGHDSTQTLNCTDFHFDQTRRYHFHCTYFSDLTGGFSDLVFEN